jgi:hypothetical protein
MSVRGSSVWFMELAWIDDLDGQAAADALVSNHARLVEADGVEFMLAAKWAELHNEDTLAARKGSGRVLPGTERARRIGSDGTPPVAEFAAAELGCLIGRGPVAALNMMANALDVEYRHPKLWAGIKAGTVRPFQACEVAKRTRNAGLSLEQARWVDAQIDGYLGSLAWDRFLALVEAKIIEVDPVAAEERRRAAALQQFVSTGQCNEFGLKTMIVKAQAGDVIFFVAMCDRIAQILLLQGDTDPVDVRRAKAIGILANPARAYALLQEFATIDNPEPQPGAGGDTNDDAEDDTDDDTNDDIGADLALFGGDPEVADPEPGPNDPNPDPEVAGEGDVHPSQNDADDPEPGSHPCPTCNGGGTMVGDPSAFVKPVRMDPKKLLPAATLYVHMSLASFLARTGGVVRAENGIGPITTEQAAGFLGHTHVTVKPVVDLANQMPVDAYESPEWMREVVHLLRPGSVFPYSPNMSRGKDLDHPVPYVPMSKGGPPGQTDPYRMGPMDRYGHRVKTHARGWRHLNPLPGVYLWRTRHGYWFRVDRHGTQPLGRNPDLAAHGVHVEEHPTTRRDAPSPLDDQFAALVRAA